MLLRAFSIVSIVLIVALTRLIPHPANFTPLLAVALFCGAKVQKRWLALIIPVAALWLSDLVLGLHDLMLVVGGALVISTLLGEWVENQLAAKSRNLKIFGWAGAGLLASIVFFLVTNFAVWQTSPGMYPHTLDGLWTCYVMGLPFFHNQVLSTWLFSGVVFGAWRAIEPKLQTALLRQS